MNNEDLESLTYLRLTHLRRLTGFNCNYCNFKTFLKLVNIVNCFVNQPAIGVTFKLSVNIVMANCGHSFSITFRVASGVTSRGANPVPPVVIMQFTR